MRLGWQLRRRYYPTGGSLRRPADLILFVLVAALAALLLRGEAEVVLDRQLVYFPSGPLLATPREAGLPFEDVRFGEQGRLHGWFVPGSGASDRTILWLHGNAGNISHRLELIALLRAGLGASVFIFDYRGYGLSRGEPSEEGIYQDARDALAYLRSRSDVRDDRIVYLGKSLGGAAAVQLAVEQPPDRLVLQAAFTSVLDLARWHYPFVPAAALLRARYPTLDRIGRVRAPVLIVHGSADTIVPLDHARKLYAAAAEPKRLYVVDGADHNDLPLVGGEGYLEALRAFVVSE